jgi:hypothetical protein
MLGDLAKAQVDIATAQSVSTSSGSSIWAERCGAIVAAQAGDVATVRSVLDSFLTRSEHEWISPMMIGQAYQALGDYDAAFQWYDRAYKVRDNLLAVIHTDRSFQISAPGAPSITSDPRWNDLLRRIGLAP